MRLAARRKTQVVRVRVHCVKESLKNDWEQIADKAYGYKYCCLSLVFQFCFISEKTGARKMEFLQTTPFLRWNRWYTIQILSKKQNGGVGKA